MSSRNSNSLNDNSDFIKDEEFPKRNEELNSKFSVFLNKKDKSSPFSDGFQEPNENLGENMYGRSYLQKIKASSQRKYIKDEKHPRMLRPPLPDGSRSKQSIYNDFKKKKENLDREKDYFENYQNGKDIVKTFSGKDSLNTNINFENKYSHLDQSVNEFAFSLRSKKPKTKSQEMPEFIKQETRVKIKSLASKIPLLREQIQKYLYEIIENKIQLDNVKYKEMERKSNLKELKTQRNNVIAERISLSKELETVRHSLSTHNTFDQKYLNRNTHNTMMQNQVQSSPINSLYRSNTLNIQNYNSFYINDENDSLCNELEQKISQLKAENSKFYENIDMLNDEIVENETVNKNLKVQLKNWDKILDSLVKERNAARDASGKYGSNKKYGSVI